MSVSLVQTVQNSLGYPLLHKIDPNSQDVKMEDKTFGNNAIAQAAIPSILYGMFNCLQNPATAAIFLSKEEPADSLKEIFGDKKKQVVFSVATYAGASVSDTENEMQHIARESQRAIRRAISDEGCYREAVDLLAGQKHEILSYLPASLQLGEVLHNNHLDDSTNKMEGPLSGLMHKIERQFNDTE